MSNGSLRIGNMVHREILRTFIMAGSMVDGELGQRAGIRAEWRLRVGTVVILAKLTGLLM